jgi:hypothetical protein
MKNYSIDLWLVQERLMLIWWRYLNWLFEVRVVQLTLVRVELFQI